MHIKPGASIAGLQVEMQPVMKHADRIWRELGEECWITSGTETADQNGKLLHSAGSLHYYGYALDLRTRYFDDNGQEAARQLRSALGHSYDVVVESNHIHVEYDPR